MRLPGLGNLFQLRGLSTVCLTFENRSHLCRVYKKEYLLATVAKYQKNQDITY